MICRGKLETIRPCHPIDVRRRTLPTGRHANAAKWDASYCLGPSLWAVYLGAIVMTER